MQRYYGSDCSDGRFTLDGSPECAATAQNESAPDSFESWDARRTVEQPSPEVCSQPAYVLNCNARVAPTCYGAHPISANLRQTPSDASSLGQVVYLATSVRFS